MVVTTEKCALTRRPVLEAEPTLESRLADARGYRVEADGDAGHVIGSRWPERRRVRSSSSSVTATASVSCQCDASLRL
jgi:hypothetical protein